MKFTAVIVALATVAAAAPGGYDDDKNGRRCTPATYQCIPYGPEGWNVCNTSGQWVFAGNCPPKTHCVFDQQNQSPYCVPPGFHIPK